MQRQIKSEVVHAGHLRVVRIQTTLFAQETANRRCLGGGVNTEGELLRDDVAVNDDGKRRQSYGNIVANLDDGAGVNFEDNVVVN
jgi:hypothetical protein